MISTRGFVFEQRGCRGPFIRNVLQKGNKCQTELTFRGITLSFSNTWEVVLITALIY